MKIMLVFLQVYKKDVSELELPEGKDVLQVLWCPEDHVEHYYAPKCKALWRSSFDIVIMRKDFPKPVDPKEEYLIKTCTVNPEEVIEYPSIQDLYELDPQLADRIINWEEENGEEPVYQYQLSVADGSKLGGYVHWIQDPEVPVCECGRSMEHLLTISDSEFDGGSYKRWCPEEFADNIWRLPYEERRDIQSPLGVRLGDMGKLFIFVCKHCEDWPIKTVFQCS